MRANARLPIVGALLVAAAAVASCRVDVAQAAAPAKIDVELIAPAADSVCWGLRWTPVDGAQQYGLVVTSDRSGDAEIHQTLTDHQAWVCAAPPAAGDTITLHAVVWGIRYGVDGLRKGHSWQYSTELPPLAAPDSVWVDSIVPPTKPDSTPTSPPAGDVGGDSIPSPVASLFVTPRESSPRLDFARYTFTDFCYCDADKAVASRRFDLVMSGDAAKWKELNPTGDQLRYTLLVSTLDEANKDAPSLSGKFLDDMRTWFAARPQYDMERAFLHDTATGTPADSAHRLNPFLWSTRRFVGNPLDPGWRAYNVDRYRRMAADPTRTGLFIDEMDGYNLGKFMRPAREFAGQPDSVWQNALVAQLAELRAAIAPKMLQINPAGYAYKPLEVRLALAAGSTHLETMNRATQELPSVWTLVDSLVRRGTYVDMVSLEGWHDFFGGSSKLSRESYYPRGNEEQPVYRAKLVQLASYYMVVDDSARMVGAQLDNVRYPLTPDSADLAVYYFNIGHPQGKRSVWLDTRDAVSQRARVYRRDFDHATILIRPVVYWADTLLSDTTRVRVPLPEGSWSEVKARGDIVPIDSLGLRNSEAVILVRRPQ